MRIDNITRVTFTGDKAEQHARSAHKKYKRDYGALCGDVEVTNDGVVFFEIVLKVY
jgi:hypothetical protein